MSVLYRRRLAPSLGVVAFEFSLPVPFWFARNQPLTAIRCYFLENGSRAIFLRIVSVLLHFGRQPSVNPHFIERLRRNKTPLHKLEGAMLV